MVGITEFEPMDYQDADGNWIGFDADMAKAFAESLGVEAEFQVIDWDNKVMELDGKTIDVVWNGMTLTDEVTSAMECSNAYCNNAQVVVLPADVADQYPDAASLAELNFAVESGSAGCRPRPTPTALPTPRSPDQATALLEVGLRHRRRRHHRLPDGRRHGGRGHQLRRPDLHHHPEPQRG